MPDPPSLCPRRLRNAWTRRTGSNPTHRNGTPACGSGRRAIVALGWKLVRSAGRALRPLLFQRLEPATAGTVGFLIRLTTTAVVVVIALRVAGLAPSTLALGGAVIAVVVGLAAQQTLSHVIAGSVLASAQPFRVGERVRLQGGPLAGTIEGQVTSVGLLYTTVALGENEVLVPNSVVMSVAVVPLREPAGIDLRAPARRRDAGAGRARAARPGARAVRRGRVRQRAGFGLVPLPVVMSPPHRG